ncbi:hypothetical protein L208DRAFT_68308 [Tricholoma matsutake]|nr:hypothetical protein L208DRAFT_68308 [Tricholoma matsutake 945]
MPPRSQPKIHQLQLRSHKLAILLTVVPSATFASIKAEALSALTSDVNQVEGVPKVKSEDDFEVCRAVKDKGKATGVYEVMDVSKQVREYNLASWDALYLQFRDTTTGELLPVKFTQPSIDDEDEEPPEEESFIVSTSKGKRKARPDEDD